MKFTQIHFDHFGRFRDQAFELGSINVVVGPNEAGKSTFCAGLETLLYGFSPAKPNDHPLFTWDGGSSNLRLTGLLERDHGGKLAIERELQATGKLRRFEDADSLGDLKWVGARLGNAALGEAAGTERSLYQALWSLELGDFVDFDGKTQASIDDLVLPAVEGQVLVPTLKVLADLDADAKAQYREKGNGKSVERSLKERRKELRVDLEEARGRESDLRGAKLRLPELDARRSEIGVAQGRLQDQLRRAAALEEVAGLLGDEAELRRRGGEPGRRFADPSIVAGKLADLDKRLVVPRTRLALAVVDGSVDDGGALARRSRIEGLAARVASFESKEAALVEGGEGLRLEVLDLIQDLGSYLEGSGEAGLAWLRSAPLAAIEAGLESWRASREAAMVAKLDRDHAPAPDSQIWGLGIVLGLGLIATALFVGAPLRYVLGLVGAALVAVAAFRGVSKPVAAVVEVEQSDSTAPGELRARFDGLALAGEAFGSPDGLERVCQRLGDWQRALWRLDSRAEKLEGERGALADSAGEWAQLAGEVGLAVDGDLDGRQVAAVQQQMDRGLAAALEHAARVEVDAEQRTGAAAEARELEADREVLVAEQAELHGGLRGALGAAGERPDFDAQDAFQFHEDCRLRASNLEHARQRLNERFGDLVNLESTCSEWDQESGAAPWSSIYVDELESQVGQLSSEDDALNTEVAELRQLLRIDSPAKGRSVAEVADEMVEVEAGRKSARREHDRLRLVAALLKRADRDYRAEHEPDVLRIAGKYLATFTAGRYLRLIYVDAESGRQLEVLDDRGEQRPVGEPLSRGTRDQIQLALRLALLDHLDGGRERLPLVLDEVLVHWDAQRRGRIYSALQGLSETRQVFVLTCHESFAEEAATALGVSPIQL